MEKTPKQTLRAIADRIDHALLRPELVEADVLAGLDVATRFGVASICVRPCDVALAAQRLEGSKVEVGTVIGFPHGAVNADTKLFESNVAMDQGATELDVVVNIGKVRASDWDYVRWELTPIVQAAKDQRVLTKIIFENCYLSDPRKKALCEICVDIGADFVKTSTGFGSSGATLADIALMKQAVNGKARLKAAGGISDLETALAFVQAGCDRIGCSATAAILEGLD